VTGEGLRAFSAITGRIPWSISPALIVLIRFPVLNKVVQAALKGQVMAHTLILFFQHFPGVYNG